MRHNSLFLFARTHIIRNLISPSFFSVILLDISMTVALIRIISWKILRLRQYTRDAITICHQTDRRNLRDGGDQKAIPAKLRR